MPVWPLYDPSPHDVDLDVDTLVKDSSIDSGTSSTVRWAQFAWVVTSQICPHSVVGANADKSRSRDLSLCPKILLEIAHRLVAMLCLTSMLGIPADLATQRQDRKWFLLRLTYLG